MRRLLALMMCAASLAAAAQNGVCCDPDGVNYAGPGACAGAGEPFGTYFEEGTACDPDCSNYDPCTPGSACYDPGSPGCAFIGCTDLTACNYDSTAEVDDGSCDYLTCIGQVPNYVPTDGLVVWLPLNGDFEGWSAQNVSWDVVGTSSGTDRFGLPNAATSFNGGGDWASSSQSLIPTEGDFTISIWLLGHDNGLHAEGIAQGGSNINSTYIGHTPEGNIRVGGGGNWAWDNLEVFPFDVWTHFLVTKTASISTLYLNGEVYSTSTAYTNPVNSGSTYVGKQQNPLYTEYWDGLIDDVGVWQRALNPEEIVALYNWSPIQGCTDESACNFDPGAAIDDGSCYSCDIPESHCGLGTIWDAELQMCIGDGSGDINLDGCVQLNDLLGLLGAYGNCGAEESVWQCGDPLEYQGYDYETVQIGEQCWFAENLRVENYRNGDSILANLNDDQWSSTTWGAVAVYGEDPGCFDGSPDFNACDAEQSLNEYGRMYNFYAVDDPRGLCPSGWHVPMDEEWTSMIGFLGGGGVAGYHMKATYGWDNPGSGSDSSGFSGLPGGYRDHNDGNFNNSGDNGFWWNSTTQATSLQKAVNLIWDYDSANEVSRSPRQGLSVRCIKDAE